MNLRAIGIQDYQEADLQLLIAQIKGSQDSMNACARYANGHLFNLYEERTPLHDQIAKILGGVAPEDIKAFDSFSERTKKVTHFAADQNCLIYVDAEQSYI